MAVGQPMLVLHITEFSQPCKLVLRLPDAQGELPVARPIHLARRAPVRNPNRLAQQAKSVKKTTRTKTVSSPPKKKRYWFVAARRRAIKLGVFVEDIDKRVLHGLYDGRCGICGKAVDFFSMTIDHIIPLSRGGLHCYANAQPAHAFCNHSKGNKLPEELYRAA